VTALIDIVAISNRYISARFSEIMQIRWPGRTSRSIRWRAIWNVRSANSR
jgi:hypothetical protein